MRAQFRSEFNPEETFLALRELKLSDQVVSPGQAFPKTAVSIRRLRQLFDQRALGYAGETGRDRAKPRHPSRQILREKRHALRRIGVSQDELTDIRAAQRAWLDPVLRPAAAVEIPADWRDLSWPKYLQLATHFSDVRLMSKDECTAAIEQELARRGLDPR